MDGDVLTLIVIVISPSNRQNREHYQDSRHPDDQHADHDPYFKPFHRISS
jgi:hypothetical protein